MPTPRTIASRRSKSLFEQPSDRGAFRPAPLNCGASPQYGHVAIPGSHTLPPQSHTAPRLHRRWAAWRCVCSSSRRQTLYVGSVDSRPAVIFARSLCYSASIRSILPHRLSSAANESSESVHRDEKAVLFSPASALDMISGSGGGQGALTSRALEVLTDGWVRVQPALNVLVVNSCAGVRSAAHSNCGRCVDESAV